MDDFQDRNYAIRAELEKAKTEQSKCNQIDPNLACCGALGNSALQQAQPNLRERVAMNLNRAQQEARRTDALYELQHLLDKNPDVARILDLLEVAGMR